MTEKKTTNSELKIKYVVPDHLQDCFVNGVYGGLTGRGYLHLNFFSEKTSLPITDIIEIVDGDSQQPKAENQTRESDITRLIQSSVTMDINTAISVRDWLDGKIQQHLTAHAEGTKQ